MNKRSLIIIAVVILLLLGGVVFALSSKKKPVKIDDGGVNVPQTAKESPKTLKDLLTAGVSQNCTYEDPSGNTEGTTYISGGKVRGDFTTKSEGKTITGHSIFDGKTSYVWMDDQKTGFKMDINPADTQNQKPTGTQQGVDMNKSLDYKCSTWAVDQSKFTPPADVTFTNFTIPPTGTQGGSMQGSQNLCSTCDSMSGDQKTQCLTALNCK